MKELLTVDLMLKENKGEVDAMERVEGMSFSGQTRGSLLSQPPQGGCVLVSSRGTGFGLITPSLFAFQRQKMGIQTRFPRCRTWLERFSFPFFGLDMTFLKVCLFSGYFKRRGSAVWLIVERSWRRDGRSGWPTSSR